MITRCKHFRLGKKSRHPLGVDPLNEEFSRLIDFAGWTQAHAAKELGLHPVTVNKIVNGKQRPSVTTLRLLSELSGGAINLPGEKLGSRMMTEGVVPYLAEGLEAELLRLFKQLPKDRRENLLQNARFMLSPVVPEPIEEPKVEPSRAETGGVKSANFANFTSEVPDDQQNDEKLPELPLVPEPTGKWAKVYGPHQPPKYIPPPSGGPPPMRYATGKPSEKKDKPQ